VVIVPIIIANVCRDSPTLLQNGLQVELATFYGGSQVELIQPQVKWFVRKNEEVFIPIRIIFASMDHSDENHSLVNKEM
jgi:hypothetical protein